MSTPLELSLSIDPAVPKAGPVAQLTITRSGGGPTTDNFEVGSVDDFLECWEVPTGLFAIVDRPDNQGKCLRAYDDPADTGNNFARISRVFQNEGVIRFDAFLGNPGLNAGQDNIQVLIDSVIVANITSNGPTGEFAYSAGDRVTITFQVLGSFCAIDNFSTSAEEKDTSVDSVDVSLTWTGNLIATVPGGAVILSGRSSVTVPIYVYDLGNVTITATTEGKCAPVGDSIVLEVTENGFGDIYFTEVQIGYSKSDDVLHG